MVQVDTINIGITSKHMQQLASIQHTVHQTGVAAPKKIWEPPDMWSLHYFFNNQLSLSDSVLS